MTQAALSIRPRAVSVRLSDNNPKIVEIHFISDGLSMMIDVPRNDFEMLIAKWDDLRTREHRENNNQHQLGLFRRAP